MQETNRIVQYDILRGIAISLMLMANSAASILTVTPPFLLRLVGSFAAPLFMVLVGMMLVITKKPKPSRGLIIVGIGCLVDLAVWQVLPFIGFDVLYTIGISICLLAYPVLIQFLAKTPAITFILAPFVWLGRRSLWIYILHLADIRFGLKPFFTTQKLDVFLWTVLGFLVGMAIIARYLPTKHYIQQLASDKGIT